MNDVGAMEIVRNMELQADVLEKEYMSGNLANVEKLMSVLSSMPITLEMSITFFETTSKPFVHFLLSKLTRNIFLHQWSRPQPQDARAALDHFLKLTVASSSSPHYVHCSLIDLLCITYKKTLSQFFSANVSPDVSISSIVQQLIQNDDFKLKTTGFLIMKNVVTEVADESKISSFHITESEQNSVRVYFQESELKGFFSLCLKMLQFYSQLEADVQWRKIAELCLMTLSDIMSWNFSSTSSVTCLGEISFAPPESWSDAIFEISIPELIFELSKKIRLQDADLVSQLLMCTARYSSMNGRFVHCPSVRDRFITPCVLFFLSYTQLPLLTEVEVLGLSFVIVGLVANIRLSLFAVDKQLQLLLLRSMKEVTCYLCMLVASTNANQDQSASITALENLMECWFNLTTMGDCGYADKEVLSELCHAVNSIFEQFLKSRICVPEGLRNPTEVEKDLDVQYNNEVDCDEDDIVFSGHLFYVAMFARRTIQTNLPFIVECLSTKTQKLQDILSTGSTEYLLNLHEDIHWLLLILTGIVADSDEYESCASTVPKEIMNYSDSLPVTNFEDIMANDQIVFVKLVKWIESFCKLQFEANNKGLHYYLSPRVELSFLAFLRRLTTAYLMFKESLYDKISIIIAMLFGIDGDISNQLVELFVEKIIINTTFWSAEEKIIEESKCLYQDMLRNKEISKVIARLPRKPCFS